MILITIVAVICEADKWTEIADVGPAKLDWFQIFLKPPHGITSRDTYGRVFASIDGKTLHHSYDLANNKAARHMVSAWCQANQMGVVRGLV